MKVKQGKVKRGDRKPGEQMHLQIIVSRKDAGDSIKLSPLNNSRGGNESHSQKVGQFDRVAFKEASERLFDSMFDYERQIKESFRYANTLKHGSSIEQAEVRQSAKNKRVKHVEKAYSKAANLLETLLKSQGQNHGVPVVDEGFKRRKKKKRNQGYGHGL
jgi:hypothetical protein